VSRRTYGVWFFTIAYVGRKEITAVVIKKYGPYKGSKENKGRKIVVKYNKNTGEVTSTNAARDKVESLRGKLSRKKHVAHSDNNKNNDSTSNLKVQPSSKNIGDGNKSRVKRTKKK
jgi:hypothetical protein